jgi:hypothetical protein
MIVKFLIKVSLNVSMAVSPLRVEHASYSSDESLGEVCGELVAWARKNGHAAQDVTVTVKFLEPFPDPL